MKFSSLCTTLLSFAAIASAALSPTPTKTRRWDKGFVTTKNGQFIRNGEPFKFLGTNAYWLPSLNTIEDINKTITNIKANGFTVIRTWAFNDVPEIPVNGTWFQHIANGTLTINEGPNGLQKLDAVVKIAEETGVLLILSLTNNWNPLPLLDNTTVVSVDAPLGRRDVTVGTNSSLPRNTLSNDYGGMDAYVREFGQERQHDEFYLNNTIVDLFKNYTTTIVTRYKDSPAVLSWELANDPRCGSSINASSVCNTTTVTNWHADVGAHVSSVDPNHIVSSGAHGFVCEDCPKLFPVTPTPAVSATPSRRKRSLKPFSMDRYIREEKAERKKTREIKKREMLQRGEGLRIRGRWIASRQADTSGIQTTGTAFDGSTGVDSQDISNIPAIGFSAFQFFPDQNDYSILGVDPSLSAVNNTINQGNKWIQIQAELAAQINKPAVMTAFGVVTNDNLPFFVPFNETTPPFPNGVNITNSTGVLQKRVEAATSGVSNEDQNTMYTSWLSTAAGLDVSASIDQWSQNGLTSNGGSSVSQPNTDTTGSTLNDDTTTSSPNDGYAYTAPTSSDTQSILDSLTSLFN